MATVALLSLRFPSSIFARFFKSTLIKRAKAGIR